MIVNKLYTLLKQKKITQAELATGVDMSTVGLIRAFQGETISVKKLIEISEFLEVPVSFWFDDDASAYKMNSVDKKLLEALKEFIFKETK